MTDLQDGLSNQPRRLGKPLPKLKSEPFSNPYRVEGTREYRMVQERYRRQQQLRQKPIAEPTPPPKYPPSDPSKVRNVTPEIRKALPELQSNPWGNPYERNRKSAPRVKLAEPPAGPTVSPSKAPPPIEPPKVPASPAGRIFSTVGFFVEKFAPVLTGIEIGNAIADQMSPDLMTDEEERAAIDRANSRRESQLNGATQANPSQDDISYAPAIPGQEAVVYVVRVICNVSC